MKKFRIVTLLSTLIMTLLGFACKFYAGPGAKWLNDSLGGLLYKIIWCLVVYFILIKTKPWKIALSVFIFTSALEFLQLWNTVLLEMLRSTFIGTTFVPSDFIYYIIGSLACLLAAARENQETYKFLTDITAIPMRRESFKVCLSSKIGA